MPRSKSLLQLWLLTASVLLTACAGSPVASATETPQVGTTAPTIERATLAPPTTISNNTPVAAPATALPQEEPPTGAEAEFTTDFSKHSVSYSEILSGGPPKDGIPAIDNPQFVSVDDADEWIAPVEPVILVEIDSEARAYPLQILTWHEIVNDTIGATPVMVSFCPLCNTAIVFERRVDDRTLDFGATGRLRKSNLIMYDRQTESWWQQATGEAIAGELTGAQLSFLPASLISWADFKAAHPNGQVLSRETGYNRSYGRNPYAGYDDINSSPFLYDGPETPGVLPPVARVLAVELGGETVAYPYTALAEAQVVNDSVGGTNVAVFWASGTASALDTSAIAEGRDVGAAAVYARELDGQMLTFVRDGERIVDEETGSEWNVLGQAVDGKLKGQRLTPLVGVNHFWFSWAAFKPETRVYQE
jgi:hypothetical protein